MKKIWRRIKKIFGRIGIVDKFLMLFMLILLAQTGHNLFFGGDAGADTAKIDAVVRTSSAAILGYFLSGNFIKSCVKTAAADKIDISEGNTEAITTRCSRIQIISVSVIGTVSLLFLLLYRNLAVPSHDTAVVAQLHDFVSSCVGFLVSSEKKR